MYIKYVRAKTRILYYFAQYSREQVIEAKWDSLLKKLDTGRGNLSRYHDLMAVFADMDDCLADMAQIEVEFTHSTQLAQILRHFIYVRVGIEGKYRLVPLEGPSHCCFRAVESDAGEPSFVAVHAIQS